MQYQMDTLTVTPTKIYIQGPNTNLQGNGYSFLLNILLPCLQASEVDSHSLQLHAMQTTEFCSKCINTYTLTLYLKNPSTWLDESIVSLLVLFIDFVMEAVYSFEISVIFYPDCRPLYPACIIKKM